MKVFGRRMFTKSAPMAMVAGATIAGTSATGAPMVDKVAVIDWAKSHPPEPYDPFHAARSAYNELRYKHRSLREVYESIDYGHRCTPLHIEVLKSVSPQHKARMTIAHRKAVQEADNSLLDRIAKLVGYERSKDRYNDEPQAAKGGW